MIKIAASSLLRGSTAQVYVFLAQQVQPVPHYTALYRTIEGWLPYTIALVGMDIRK